MASKSFLKNLRKKYRLGEYAKPRKKRRTRGYKEPIGPVRRKAQWGKKARWDRNDGSQWDKRNQNPNLPGSLPIQSAPSAGLMSNVQNTTGRVSFPKQSWGYPT